MPIASRDSKDCRESSMRKIGWVFIGIVILMASCLVGPVPLWDSGLDRSTAYEILFSLRMPRTVVAFMVGGGLGLSGAVLQGFLRNPLADTSLLGVGSGAAFFAVLGLSFGLAVYSPWAIPLLAIGGGIITLLLIKIFLKGQESPLHLILLGIALNSFYGSLIAFVLNISKNPYALSQMIFWLFGSYADIPWAPLIGALPFMLLGTIFLLKTAPLLDALSFGEDMAKSLGFSLKKGINFLMVGIGLIVGLSVALCGLIGFIGLVVPHAVRFLVSSKPSKTLIPSFIGGGMLSLLADIMVRLLPCQVELKVGVMTALIGSPFFIYLLYRSRHAQL